MDRFGRSWQCATIQLDFNLPVRFNLQVIDPSSGEFVVPVLIHRVVFGSIQRFFGVLIEHFGGKLPAQINKEVELTILTKGEKRDFKEIQDILRFFEETGVHVELVTGDIRRVIKSAAERKIPYLLIFGEKEAANGTITVRTLGEKQTETMQVAEFKERYKRKTENWKMD